MAAVRAPTAGRTRNTFRSYDYTIHALLYLRIDPNGVFVCVWGQRGTLTGTYQVCIVVRLASGRYYMYEYGCVYI